MSARRPTVLIAGTMYCSIEVQYDAIVFGAIFFEWMLGNQWRNHYSRDSPSSTATSASAAANAARCSTLSPFTSSCQVMP